MNKTMRILGQCTRSSDRFQLGPSVYKAGMLVSVARHTVINTN